MSAILKTVGNTRLVFGHIPECVRIEVPNDCTWWRVRCRRGFAELYMRRGGRFEKWSMIYSDCGSVAIPHIRLASNIRRAA